jgi:hypothetical protein
MSASQEAHDRRIHLPGGWAMCMYDLDVRDVHHARAARRIVDALNARLALGREREPWAAHYVNVIGRRGEAHDSFADIDDVVRAVLFPEGIVGADSVAIEAR